MYQITTEHINEVSTQHGWLWINEGVRYVIQAKYVWISTLLLFGVFSMFLIQLLPIFQVFLIFIVPFITAGLSLACAEIEQGKPMTIEYLFKAFLHPNRMNIFRYGFVLVLMMVLAQFLASLMLGAYGVSQQQVIEEMARLAESQEQVSWVHLWSSPVLSAYAIFTLLSVLPVFVINMLSPIILVFSQFSAFQAVKMSFVGGYRNLSALLCYGLILLFAVFVLGIFFYVINLLLGSIFGQDSTVASIVYMLMFFSMTLLLVSLSYSSAYVAFKDIFIKQEN